MSRLRVLPLPSTCPPPLEAGAEAPYRVVRRLRTGTVPTPVPRGGAQPFAQIVRGDGYEHLHTTEQPYVQDALALDYSLVDAEEDDRYFDRQRSGTTALPDPQAFAVQLAQALVEVMSGTRAAPQVIRWLSPQVYAVLAHRALVATRRAGATRSRTKAAVVRRVLVDVVADGVAEVTVIVVYPDRVRALALRMAGVDHRWVVTDLVMG